MFEQIFRRFRRAPKMALGAAVFALVLALALCGLEWSNHMEQANYEQARHTIPVTLTVTNLTGIKTTGLEIPFWAVNAFTAERLAPNSLSEMVKDLKLKAEDQSAVIASQVDGEEKGAAILIGLTDIQMDPGLSAQSGDMLRWLEGFDESILESEEEVCIVPESWMAGKETAEVHLELRHVDDAPPYEVHNSEETLTVVGAHMVNENTIYLPYFLMNHMEGRLGKAIKVTSLSATVLDNDQLPQVREMAAKWFAEPNLKGEKTPWDYSWYSYYPFALKVDDSQLKAAAENMENSILINGVCTVLVFVLAAGASFFVGFLMIRSRKREITIMRTLGTPTTSVFLSFALEQAMCMLAGVILGGAPFLWQPLDQLGLFAGIYILGLSLALVIFLGKNLMSTMKEDE